MNIHYRRITKKEELEESKKLRFRVFIQEQHIPEDLERDELDAKSMHVTAIVDGRIVGTGRITLKGDTATISRIAVEKNYRRMGIGTHIMQELEDIAKHKQVKTVTLSSNFQSISFYQTLAYTKKGAPFIECGGEVQKMVKMIT